MGFWRSITEFFFPDCIPCQRGIKHDDADCERVPLVVRAAIAKSRMRAREREECADRIADRVVEKLTANEREHAERLQRGEIKEP